MSEISLLSAKKSTLNIDVKRGSKKAKTAIKLSENPDKFFSTVQIGITLIGILTGIYSGDTIAQDLSNFFIRIGIPASYTTILSKTIIVILVTYFTIVLGELVPKRIGLATATKTIKLLAGPMHVLSVIASPFVWILAKSTALTCQLLGISASEEKVTEEDIMSMVDEGTENGEVQKVEQDIVDRVFTLGDRVVSSIMTHRGDMTFICESMTNQEVIDTVRQHLYQVYPVTRNKKLDDIIGVVYLKDLFGKVDKPDFKLKDVIRPAFYFHENMDVYKALEQLREKNSKYALITDEFGVVQGIIVIKDILSALVGTLPGDKIEQEIMEREDGESWLVDGQCSFYNFLNYFDSEYLYSDNNYNTISGLILNELRHIPTTGEVLNWNNFRIEIVDMDGARIDKLLVMKNN